MRGDEIASQAHVYLTGERCGAADALLSVLVDLLTCCTGNDVFSTEAAQQAWDRLTRDLGVPEWLEQSELFTAGIEALAANLAEAGSPDLADRVRAVRDPRVKRPPASGAVEPAADAGDDEGRLWVGAAVAR